MGLHSPFEDLEPYDKWLSCTVHKLWPKEWPRVKLWILLLVTKMSNIGIKTFPIGMCDTTLENSFQGLQLCLWGLPNQNPYAKIINLWNSKIYNLALLKFFEGLQLGGLGILLPFQCSSNCHVQIYYKGKNVDSAQVWAMVNHANVFVMILSLHHFGSNLH